MKKIQYNGSSKLLNGIVTKVNLIIDKLIVDVKVNGTSVVVVNEDGEREADIDLSLADQNVKQSPTTSSDNSDYRVLLSKSANDTEETDISRKDTNLKYNPSTGNLQTTKLNGNTVPSGSGNDTLAKTSDIPDLSNYVQKSLTVGLIKNDGTIDQTQYATMSDIPDELADLQDDENHRLVTDSEISAWNGKAETSDITSAINDLDVASTSIGQGETLATIKEENGKIAVTKQNIKIGLGQVDNICLVGTSSAITSGVTWHKFASITITTANTDASIMLAVTDTYIPDTASGSDSNGGILYCRVRQGSPVGTFAYAKLKFVANSGLDASNFRLYYTTSSSGITFELWTSLTQRWAFRRFTMISQGDRTSAYSNSWTLYNTTSPTSAPTESATCVRVECEDNTYKQIDNNLLGSKNLLKYPYYSDSYTSNGITWTLNADGTVTAKGTSTAISQFYLHTRDKSEKNDFTLPNGTYILSDGGLKNINTEIQMGITRNGAWSELAYTRNGDVQFTANGDDYSADSISPVLSCVIRSGQQNVNVTFKPMIRLATIADNTYVPYAQTNRQLTTDKVDYNDYVKNLLPYPWSASGMSSMYNRGITFTYNEEGYVTLNGTADATNQPYMCFTLATDAAAKQGNELIVESGKKYTLSIDRTDNRLFATIFIRNTSGASASVATRAIYEDGTVRELTTDFISLLYSSVFHKKVTFEILESGSYRLQVDLRVSANSGSYTNAKGRVSLYNGYMNDDTWTKYAKTNYQLTTDKAEVKDLEKAYTDEYNLLHQLYYDQIQNKRVYRGVTFDINKDSIRVSGTASTSNPYYVFRSLQDGYCPNKNEVYHLEGCPSGGSTNTYWLVCQFVNSSGTTISYAYDFGNGVDFVLPDGTTSIGIIFYVKANYAISGTKTVTPKLTVANKYASSNVASVEWTNTASKAYDVGDYMVWRNKLYIVRAAISSGGAITVNTNVEATDIGSEVKKSKIWGNENIATIPNSSSSSKVYVTTSAYTNEIYLQMMNIKSTSLGINETGYCSVTIPILPSMTNNYFVFMFRGFVDNKLYDGRLLFRKDSNGVYGYVSQVYQDGVLKSANDLEADIVVFEKS